MNNYYFDKPICNSSEDLLDRASFSKLLANTIINLQGTDTFTVGLFGKWGNGKTSIVNMALQELEPNDLTKGSGIVVVRFEPWHFSDSTQLLSQFFVRLSSELKKCSDKNMEKIGKAIEDYSNTFDLANFIPVYGPIVAAAGKWGLGIIGRSLRKNSNELDILTQKQEVIDLLKKQDKKVLVVIDDIDRLNSEQIRQVFQLVSSVAKFPNTTYLLVFDKDVVVKSLEKVQEGRGDEYLEKVIQMPIQIPDIQKENLNSVLFNRLDEIIATCSDVSFDYEHWQKIFPVCVSPFISNLRDINRLCNSLRFKLTTIASEIDFADMIAISAIEIGAANVYEWIKSQKDVLTSSEGPYTIYKYEAKRKTQKEYFDFYRDIINKLLKEGCSSKCDVDIVIMALVYLFPYFGQRIGKNYMPVDDDLFRRNNLISHPEKFERYFYYDIDRIVLKKSSINAAVLSLSEDEFMEFIINEDKNERGIVALREIKAMISQISTDRAKLIFKALIRVMYKLRTVERKSIVSVGAVNYVEFLFQDLMEQINEAERCEYFSEVIKNADIDSLSALAVFINMIELGYGRLAANGSERAYKKVITLEELFKIENVFKDKIKKVLEKTNLFDFTDWRMILHLLESFDGEYADNYLIKALKTNKNIISYLQNSVSLWIGTRKSYSINTNYSKYLTKEIILGAIKEEINNRNIFQMKKEEIEKAAAFCLQDLGQTNWEGHVMQENVDKTIESWRNEGITWFCSNNLT